MTRRRLPPPKRHDEKLLDALCELAMRLEMTVGDFHRVVVKIREEMKRVKG